MHGPTNRDHRENDGQLNILIDRFENMRKDYCTDYQPVPWYQVGGKVEGDPEEAERHAQLRIWKLLRELDVMPVFLPHLEKELCKLLSFQSKVGEREAELAEQLKLARSILFNTEMLAECIRKSKKCDKCEEARVQAKAALSKFKGKNNKTAKTICNYVGRMLGIWKEEKNG